MIIKIMIRIGSLSLFENVEIRNQRYTSVILSFKNQLYIMIFIWYLPNYFILTGNSIYRWKCS